MSSTDEDVMKPHGVAYDLRSGYKKHEHLIKYFVIGCTASALDVIIFLVLYNVVGTSELFAHSISVPTSVLFSFVTNARHNFHTNDYIVLRMVSFFIVCTIGYAAGFGVIKAVMLTGFDANTGKILSLPVVFVIQYILNSRITFRKATAGQG